MKNCNCKEIVEEKYNKKLISILEEMEELRENYNENSNDAGVDAVSACMALVESVLP